MSYNNAQWGATAGSGNRQGCIGIATTLSSTDTITTVTCEVYYWTKYAVSDSSNKFYFGFGGNENYLGGRSISHGSNTAWSTSNITLIGTYTESYARTGSSQTGVASASFSGIEYGGGSGSVSINFTVPAKPAPPQPEKYYVSYDANGGYGSPYYDTVYYGESYITKPNMYSRTGYTFMGWNTDPNGNGTDWTSWIGRGWRWSYDYSVTLYAQWKKNLYPVSFDAGANGGTVKGTSLYTLNVPYQEEVGKLPEAVKENHRFMGWNKRADGTGEFITEQEVITSGVTVFAIFKPIGDVYVRVNGHYVPALMYRAVSGKNKPIELYVRVNGHYIKTIL